MKIRYSQQNGNVLVISLLLSMVLGTILAGYLQNLSTQNRLTVRSQSWNMAIAAAEAGIEEAMTHLNFTNNLATSGWEMSSDQFTKTRMIQNNRYTVGISTNRNPVVIAQGYVQLPGSTNFISRTVRVTTQRSGLFTKAMVAKGQIDLKGNNIKTDSFDSTDPSYSGADGRYDSTKVKSNGDVATDSELINSLALGNANIWGHVSTGPGGSISIGPNGSVGDIDWQTSGQKGIKPGWSSDDMNVDFPDVTMPFSGGAFIPVKKQVNGDWVDYVIDGSGNWQLSQLNGSLLVRSNVNAVLLVRDSISISGQSYIKIETGATLKLYMQGASTSIGGNGIINGNARATNFFYYGMPSNTSLSIKGNGTFTGVIYAPNADFVLAGGGSGDEDFTGSSVTSTVTMGGHFKFHYDESLGNLDGGRGYLITSWNEL